MRKLIYGINLTLDGCCDHTKGSGHDDVLDYFGQLMREADTLVYGRITYQLMVPFWPDLAKSHAGPTKSTNDFADAFDAVGNIVVFSKTMEQTQGGKTRVVRSNLKDEILKLKQQQGRNILLGGVDIPSQLLELGLIDEYRIMVQPAIVGEGRRLFDGVSLAEKLKLKLVGSKGFNSGFIALHYLKDPEA